MKALALLAALLLAGCSGWQSALDPHSSEAAQLAGLFWFFTAVCALIWIAVVIALAMVLLRRRRTPNDAPEEEHPMAARRKTTIVTGLALSTALVLLIFGLTSFYATRGITWYDTQTITLKVTGQQWWWQVEYQNQDASQDFITANEIHIPVGKPVTLELDAMDVIHSFWVPSLMGKKDLIPGRKNFITLKADEPGLYRGQCAEFCGLEHAKMAILVFAEPQDKFEAWRRHQIEAAKTPGAPERLHGMDIFVHRQCASCHSISGTDAGGQTAPDLTHFGGRATIAAGLFHNTPDNLDRWLANPQQFKPGSNMPQVPLSREDRAALVAYLEGLT